MNRNFGGWQRENQPVMPGINRKKIENIAKERPVGFRILASRR
jgi:hypothetical protein